MPLNNLYGCILAGGSGTRFWPLSRQSKPKQFLNICGDYSMLQMTFNRLSPLIPDEKLLIIGNKEHKELINEQLPVLQDTNILLEPKGKNTALAIGIMAKFLLNKDPNAIMLIVASDHDIKHENEFLRLVQEGVKFIDTQPEALLLFGIVPDKPATGYGYIEKGIDSGGISKVAKFVEKPILEKAKEFVSSGQYLWNSGMFMWKAATILKNMKEHMPELYEQLINTNLNNPKDVETLYELAQSQSIDYGVLEKAYEVLYVLPTDIGWNDVGSWDSVEFDSLDENILHIESNNITIKSNKFVATIGLNDIMIIETDDAILVFDKNRAQDVKKIVDELKNKNKIHLL
jgi:mannose-1-phosphate guanylyltransferase